jgi:hypothetical protein
MPLSSPRTDSLSKTFGSLTSLSCKNFIKQNLLKEKIRAKNCKKNWLLMKGHMLTVMFGLNMNLLMKGLNKAAFFAWSLKILEYTDIVS